MTVQQLVVTLHYLQLEWNKTNLLIGTKIIEIEIFKQQLIEIDMKFYNRTITTIWPPVAMCDCVCVTGNACVCVYCTSLRVAELRGIIWLSDEQVQTVIKTSFLQLIIDLLSSQPCWRDVHIERLGTTSLSRPRTRRQSILVNWYFTLK